MRLKKKLAIVMCIVCLFNLSVANADIIDVQYNDLSANLKGHTYIENNIVMLPLREVAEDAQYIVEWENSTQTARLIKGNVVIDVPIGAKEVDVMGTKVSLPTPVVLRNSTTYVPVDLIKNLTGALVNWDETKSMLAFSTKEFYSYDLLGSASLLNQVESRGLLAEYDYETVTDAQNLLLSKGGKYQGPLCQLSMTDDAYAGYQALKVKSLSTHMAQYTNMQRIVTDEILANGAGKYRFSVWVKPLTEGDFGLSVNCQPGGASAFGSKSTTFVGGYWGKFSMEFDVDPGNYTYFVLNIGTEKFGSTFILDNICFEKIS